MNGQHSTLSVRGAAPVQDDGNINSSLQVYTDLTCI